MTAATSVGSAANATDDRQCQICHTRPARPGGAVCWTCMGSEASDPVPVAMPGRIPYVGEIICPRCGKPHDGFLINGRGTSTTCKECIVAKRKATFQKNKGKHKWNNSRPGRKTLQPKSIAPVPEPTAIPEPGTTLLLDFTDHPYLLEQIKQMAFKYFRTPEAQILWLISTQDDLPF